MVCWAYPQSLDVAYLVVSAGGGVSSAVKDYVDTSIKETLVEDVDAKLGMYSLGKGGGGGGSDLDISGKRFELKFCLFGRGPKWLCDIWGDPCGAALVG